MRFSIKIMTGLAGAIAASLLTFSVQAAPITTPSGLSAGDTYRLAFVTSFRTDAFSDDIDYYNDFVDLIGDTVIASDWRAIASTSFMDAYDNTSTRPSNVAGGTVGGPIYLLDGSLLVQTNDDLWDTSIGNPLNIDETGTTLPSSQRVWTGTRSDGTAGVGLGVFTFTHAEFGWTNRTIDEWIEAGTISTFDSLPLYALSGLLTVTSVPAPGSLSVLAFGLVILGFAQRRRAAKTTS